MGVRLALDPLAAAGHRAEFGVRQRAALAVVRAEPLRLGSPAAHGASHPITGIKVVLTTAHMNDTPEGCRDENLRALCQRCHLGYDRPGRLANQARNRRVRQARGGLLDG